MEPFEELSFGDALKGCVSAMGASSVNLSEEPLRCMAPTPDGRAFQVAPYETGQSYVGISYTWPNPSWHRKNNSNYTVPIIGEDGSRSESQHVSHFAQAVMKSIRSDPALSNVSFWVDHECINQDDEVEKQSQVAIMDKIYTKAQFTAILLEDVELSTEDLDFLKLNRRKVGDHLERHTQLTRKILAGRWFSRAWCTQEMILSRGSILYLHRTEDVNSPISFALSSLTGWMSTVRMHDRSLTRLSEPRGINGTAQSTYHTRHTMAWAFGVVQKMGCYNMYDKVSLVQNLIRAPVESRLKQLPDSKGKQDPAAHKNITKIINVLALINGDFSLLQTNHVDESWLQASEEFRWAGDPIPNDSISESWHSKNYEVEMDPRPPISESGITLKGYAAKIVKQVEWEISRDGNSLRGSKDGVEKSIDSDWLSNELFTPSSPLSMLRDVLYAIEAFGANDIYPFFLPAQDNWIEREPFVGFLEPDMVSHYSRVSSTHEVLAQGLRFLQTEHFGIPILAFSVLYFERARPLVARANVGGLKGKMVFQPCVMRPKVFGGYLLTSNAMVFEEEDFGKDGTRNRCIGNLRSMGLVPDERGLMTITVC